MVATARGGTVCRSPEHEPFRRPEPSETPTLSVASSFTEVIAAWRLVYRSYLRAGWVDPNPYRLHTVPGAATRRAVVFLERRHERVSATLTAVVDQWSGLPLDEWFGQEADALRRAGRRLLECTQFAQASHDPGVETAASRPLHRPDDAPRRPAQPVGITLRRLLVPACAYAIQKSVTDILVAAPESLARLYGEALHFQPLAGSRPCGRRGRQPLVLLHCDLLANLQERPLPPVIDALLRRPVGQALFDRRFRFVSGIRPAHAIDLADYLRWAYPNREAAA